MRILLLLMLAVLMAACKKESENKLVVPGNNHLPSPPSLISPLNSAIFSTDTYLLFSWTKSMNASHYLVFFAKDRAMSDTVKSIKVDSSYVGVLLTSLGRNYKLFWTVYAVDSNNQYNLNNNVNELIFDGVVHPEFVTKFVFPESNATVFKDERSVIDLKWTKQPTAVSYEIQVDYTPAFTFMSTGFIDNNFSPAKLMIVNAPDTIATIFKHKIDWNKKMYLRIRAVYSNNETSIWSETLTITISDPRPKYLGNYSIDFKQRSIIAGFDTTIYYDKISSTVINTDNSSLSMQSSVLTWTYNPFYFLQGIEEYGQDTFFGNPDASGRPTGNIYFRNSIDGDTTYISGSKVNYSLPGTTTYTFSGYKLN